jgi:uncharacterized SAM-dependent methyltransferase
MPEFIRVKIHQSAQPRQLMSALRRSFEQRCIDPKFHYLNARQSQAWLALHHKYSPFAASSTGMDVYDSAFNWAAKSLPGGAVALVSLACGGAGKELRLVKSLRRAGKEILATLSDISVPLVIEGYQTLSEDSTLAGMEAVVLDLLEAGDLNRILTAHIPPAISRVVTCFGLMPNADPLAMAARLAALTTKDDVLLVGANLVSASNYEQNTRNVLGDYNNDATRGWLTLLLTDSGFDPDDGEISFDVEPCAGFPELQQIVARFRLRQERTIELAGEKLKFSAGENLRLFFSNRFTPGLLRRVFELRKMKILGEWVSAEETEGVIACGVTSP